MKCCYHVGDLDGKCSAAIIRTAHPDVELIGIEHGDPFPWHTFRDGETVYMVDWSLTPFEQMARLARNTNLIWIDHHKTALDAYIDLVKGQVMSPLCGNRGIDQAACELTWRHCFKGRAMPRAVYLLGRYDIWDHDADEDVLPFQFGMRARENDPESMLWDELLGVAPFSPLDTPKETIATITRDGRAILTYQQQLNAQLASNISFEAEVDGLQVIAANVSANSLFFDSVWDPERYDACCVFRWEGSRWRVSLYTDKEGVDVGQIAKARGGGGHAGAAGFRATELPFMQEQEVKI